MFVRCASGHTTCMTDTNPLREDDDPHGPGGMDGIEDEPVRAPDDEDAPGGMTGIPDPDAD